MRKVTFVLATLVAAFLFSGPAFSRPQQDSPKDKSQEDARKDCPLHEQHMAANKSSASAHSHQSACGSTLESRGDRAMGFEQSKTTHHFLLKPDGGAIQVQADDPQDTVSPGQIRKHFHRIAAAFAAGDFEIPMMVHDTVPPGANAMKRLREKIHYTYEELPAGARVVIKTADPSALDAIHDFLRYQIREHETGDPLTTSPPFPLPN
jgi:hypothetical protein